MTVVRPVEVRYFAAAADAAGKKEETLAVPTGYPVKWLRQHLIASYGAAMEKVLTDGTLLIDGVANHDDEGPIGHRVDVLPAYAGA